MLQICIRRRFLEDCFYGYSQQIVSAVANESLIPYRLIKRSKQIKNKSNKKKKKKYKIQISYWNKKILFYTNISNKNTRKIVCKIQCLKMACNSMYHKAQ